MLKNPFPTVFTLHSPLGLFPKNQPNEINPKIPSVFTLHSPLGLFPKNMPNEINPENRKSIFGPLKKSKNK